MAPTKHILTLLLFVAVVTAAGEVNLKKKVGKMFSSSKNTATETQDNTREFLEASKAKASNHGLGTGARKELSESKEILKGAASALESRQNQATQPTMTQHESSTLAKLRAELKDIHKSYTQNAPARSYTAQSTRTTSSEAKNYEAIRAAAKNQRKIMATSQLSVPGADDATTTEKQARQERALQAKYNKLAADLGGAGDATEGSSQEVFEEEIAEPSSSASETPEVPSESSQNGDNISFTEVTENSISSSSAIPSNSQEQESSTITEQSASETETEESENGSTATKDETTTASTTTETTQPEPSVKENTATNTPTAPSSKPAAPTQSATAFGQNTTNTTNSTNSTKSNQTDANKKKSNKVTRPSSARIAIRKPLALKKLSTTMAHILEHVNRRVVEPVVIPEPLYAYRLQQTILGLSKEGQKLSDNVSRENKKKWEKEVRTELENL